MVQESHCSWSKRLRLYNQFVQGNAELLSISSDDSIWNSDDDEDSRKKRKIANTDEDEIDVIIDTDDQNSKESIQYKKTMMQRYLNDAVEAKNSHNATSTSAVISESQGKTDNTVNVPSTVAVSSTYLTTPTYSRMYWPPPPPHALPPLPGVFPWLPLPPTLLNASQNGKILKVIAFVFYDQNIRVR